MMILYGLDLWTTMSPLLTPRWQQGIASLKRLLKKSGALTRSPFMALATASACRKSALL
jgi:hypothetical protein